jgi:tRNA U34 5-carboxymethylaminomethyl modifying enzyme MnmG/GidA
MAVDLDIGPNDEVRGVRTYFGINFKCKSAVLTTGTFMNGKIWVGRQSMSAGRSVAASVLFVRSVLTYPRFVYLWQRMQSVAERCFDI